MVNRTDKSLSGLSGITVKDKNPKTVSIKFTAKVSRES